MIATSIAIFLHLPARRLAMHFFAATQRLQQNKKDFQQITAIKAKLNENDLEHRQKKIAEIWMMNRWLTHCNVATHSNQYEKSNAMRSFQRFIITLARCYGFKTTRQFFCW